MAAHVLLVEDSVLVTDALRILLESTGNRVSVASSVALAVEACRAERPDLMLLDLTLGDDDGLDALAEVRRIGREPAVTVAMTGHDEDAVRDRCLAAGCRAVLVEVGDTGIGIAPEHHDLVFQEFAQVDSSASRKHHGTGLGLTIARKLVELHRGRIWLESQVGGGSRFFFTIPYPAGG